MRDHFVDAGFHPYRDPQGSTIGVLAIVHDVTDKVLARMRESELRREAEAANRAKDEFLATVSHELRNPLNAILGWSRLLTTSLDPQRLAKGLAIVARNAEAQAKLIDDLLDMSRIASGKVVLDLRRVQLEHVIRNAVESVRPAAAAKNIGVQLELDDAGLDLVCDEDRVQQVVWNLLSNAVKFTNLGGRVRVVAVRKSGRVVITVEDSGKGISADLLPHVFDRFRQGDGSTTKRHGGLGLGLAIVRQLVDMHGGTVRARSDGEGRGAAFEIELPVRATEPRAVGSESAFPEGAGAAGRPQRAEVLKGVPVLVVDDEDDARELVATVLQEAGAVVSAAASVQAAMQILESRPVAVVISDIGMPIEDGYSLVERLRAAAPQAMKDIPALALTAYARTEDRRRAAEAGFQEHVAKPVDPEVLVRTVAALASR
jgi:signal transduction histidine kinase/CheY-like chemotaxis protein